MIFIVAYNGGYIMVVGDLFNKKFLYVEWDDCLQGKDVLLCDDIVYLRQGDLNFEKCENGGGLVKTFKNADEIYFRFAYYDPNLRLKEAFLQGKKIMAWFKSDGLKAGEIDDISTLDDDGYIFEIVEELKYIPFCNVESLIEYWIKKTNVKLPENCNPFIWVRNKLTKEEIIITGYNRQTDYIYVDDDFQSLESLFEKYEFLDGSPCGVKE